MQPNCIPTSILTPTLALDAVLAQDIKVLAKVDQAMAKSNAIIDQSFRKVNRVIDAAMAKAFAALVSNPHVGR